MKKQKKINVKLLACLRIFTPHEVPDLLAGRKAGLYLPEDLEEALQSSPEQAYELSLAAAKKGGRGAQGPQRWFCGHGARCAGAGRGNYRRTGTWLMLEADVLIIGAGPGRIERCSRVGRPRVDIPGGRPRFAARRTCRQLGLQGHGQLRPL